MMDSDYMYKYDKESADPARNSDHRKDDHRNDESRVTTRGKRRQPDHPEKKPSGFRKSSLWQHMEPASGPLQAAAGNIREAVIKYLELFQQLYFEEFFLFFATSFGVFLFFANAGTSSVFVMFLLFLWGLSVIIPIIAYFKEIPSRLLFRRAPFRILSAYGISILSLLLINQQSYSSIVLFSLVFTTLVIEFFVQWNERKLLTATIDGEAQKWNSPRENTRQAITEAGFTRDRVENEVRERLKAEQLRTELITNISHDIRTPLTSIINFTELLKGEDLEPEARDYLLVVDKSANRMRIMVDDLFTATKTAAGNLTVNVETVDLSEVLMQTYAPLDNLFQEKGLELDYDRRDDTVALRADGTHLSRVIQNLLINAVKYSVRDTRVYVRVKDEKGDYRIRVTNISRQKLDITPEDLMEKFVRGDQSRQAEGSGLGLYIAQNLMELMQGHLTLKIEGDVFTAELSLPKGIDATIGEEPAS